MAELFAYLAGILLTAGVYLVVQPQPVRMVFGVVLIGNAMNLGIIAVGRTQSRLPPFVPPGADAPLGAVANPLPQALVLTALVISFGLTAFALALIARLARAGEGVPGTDAGPGVRPSPSESRARSALVAGPETEVGIVRENGRESERDTRRGSGRGRRSP